MSAPREREYCTRERDFAIPVTAWEAHKARSNSDLLHPDSPAPPNPTFATNSTLVDADSDSRNVPAEESVDRQDVEEVPAEPDRPMVESKVLDEKPKNLTPPPVVKAGDGGIRGARPPVLAPPPVISTLSPPPGRRVLAPAIDSGGSTWDLLKSFGPDEENNDFGAEGRRRSFNSEEDEQEQAPPAGGEVAGLELRLEDTSEDFTGTSSYSTMNDDDASGTTAETMFIISRAGLGAGRTRRSRVELGDRPKP